MLPKDQQWNTVIAIAAASTLAAILGFAYGASFVSDCPDIKDAPFGCAEFLLFRYQTLLGLGGAVVAALITARPVWRQFHLMSLQTTIAMHGALTERIRILNRRSAEESRRIQDLVTDLQQGHYETSETSSLSHWAWDIEQRVGSEIEYLLARQRENIEGDEATIARQHLLNAMESVRKCLSDINVEVHLERAADEIEITDQMVAAARETSDKATDELSNLIGDVLARSTELERGRAEDLDSLRLNRQLMSQILAASTPFS